MDVIDTCLTTGLSFSTISDLVGVRVDDPNGQFTRTIVASDTESVVTSTANFCGPYTYSYAPKNIGETFAFTQTKFVLTDNVIIFASNDPADVIALNPNPFTLTITLGLENYPQVYT